ncbi:MULTISPECIES: LPS export ABC transporter permease LptG [unclassified Moraxella]|uniref:LPS export ABC transporter permease LptG n=1 Tax=unclassified Moraxella TaxID=2685852 RepID=UPI003AF69FA9
MIIARYVKKQALFAIIGAVLGLWLLKLVFEYLAELDGLSDQYTYLDALRYIAYSAPEALQNYMPIGALMGAVIGLGMLANHSELTVMQASGLSRFKIVGWILQPAMLFVILGLLLSQFVLPTTNHLARQLKQDNPLLSSSISGYWQKQNQQIVAIDYADATGQLKNVRIWDLSNTGEVTAITQANTGRYQQGQQWQLIDAQRLQIQADGTTQKSALASPTVALPIEPQSIYLLTRSPDDMSITELWQHRQFLAKEQRRSLEHEVAFWKKVLSPFAVLSLVLVACSFVFGSLRSQSLGYRIVMALLFGLVFSYIQDLVGFVSLSTGFSPFIMVLLPIVVSALLGVYLIKTKN